MSKENVQEVMLGVVAVVLAYAVYRHMKPGAVQAIAPTNMAASPVNPNRGTPYNPANPAALAGGLGNLLAGTIHDISTGNNSASGIPTTQDIIDNSLGNVPNYSDINGNNNPDSVVFVDNGNWWEQ